MIEVKTSPAAASSWTVLKGVEATAEPKQSQPLEPVIEAKTAPAVTPTWMVQKSAEATAERIPSQLIGPALEVKSSPVVASSWNMQKGVEATADAKPSQLLEPVIEEKIIPVVTPSWTVQKGAEGPAETKPSQLLGPGIDEKTTLAVAPSWPVHKEVEASSESNQSQLLETAAQAAPSPEVVASLGGANVGGEKPENFEIEVVEVAALKTQITARMRWLERRRLMEADLNQIHAQSKIDQRDVFVFAPEMQRDQASVVVQAETVEKKLGSAFPVTAQAYPHVQRMRSDVPETVNVIDDLPANDPFTQPTPFSSPLAGSGVSIHPAKDIGRSSDTAWVIRTLQDTVRTTLRTLAQRDLESLDSGRPIQITLDQGQLRGAQLTLQAKEGLLEISVSTSQAQLRATFEAQQDVLAQGLLRDIGAVRWMGLQDAVQSLTSSSNSESDSSSTTSQQNSQGRESGQQNQSRSPSPEPEELPRPIKQADRSQVIADAQSLRAFLGL